MSDQTDTPEEESTDVAGYIDESVVDDADGDDGLGEPEDDGLDRNVSEPVDLTDVDATGDHPGDVTNPEYEDELSVNRSVPGVELRPNPEDTLGRQSQAAEEE